MESDDSDMLLVPLTDADFAWMIEGGTHPRRGLTLPPGGVDDVATLAHVRRIVQRLHARNCHAAWMMVCNQEVVGLCSFKTPPSPDGHVEIGYGVAALRRRRGHARRAIEALLAAATCDPAMHVVLAETVVPNPASERVLESNGFERAGRRIDAVDGEVVCWRKELRSANREAKRRASHGRSP